MRHAPSEKPAMLTSPALLAEMDKLSVKPLWDLYKGLNTREPRYLEPMIWPWAEMNRLVEQASREVDMAEAERRALMLCHPALAGTTFTTPTLSAALQILEPGEQANSHRHTLAAIRVVLTGDGAVTTTDGKPCLMEPGDLVLTPSWTWHKHFHPGRERAVWFDGLDAPLCTALGTVFFEHGPGPEDDELPPLQTDAAFNVGGVVPERAPIADGPAYSPLFRYPWASVRSALASSAPLADGSRKIRYVNPVSGGPVTPTIDCFAQQFQLGQESVVARSTSTAIVVVLEGEGTSKIGDKRFDWKTNDVFTLPRWVWHQHEAKTESASLFLMTDRALMNSLSHLREEEANA